MEDLKLRRRRPENIDSILPFMFNIYMCVHV